MLADILKQLGIDDTLWIQLGIFTFLYLFLRFFFFGPFLKLIELRERESTGVEKDAEELVKKAATSEADYQAKMAAVRKQAKDTADQILSQAKTEASKKVSSARAEAKSKIEAGREQLAKETVDGSAAVSGQVDSVATIFVEKILSAKVGL